MFAMFRHQSTIARTEGYDGLCLVAEMDWLLPAHPTRDAIIGFELMLDRVVGELDATVVCAYRREAFSPETLMVTVAVHPVTLWNRL
jgi:hypothetical protein